MKNAFAGLVFIVISASLASAENAHDVSEGRDLLATDRSCLDETLNLAQTYFDTVDDLSAEFIQENWSVALGAVGSESISSGTFMFRKPKSVRWEYSSPEPSLVVSDGNQTWIYDPSNKEVQILRNEDGDLSAGALGFLWERSDLRQNFHIDVEGCGNVLVSLTLIPKLDALFEKVKLRVHSLTGYISETLIIDPFGNKTKINFSNVQRGQGLDADLFSFQVSNDIRVVTLKE